MFHVMQIFLMCAAAVYLCAMVVVEVRRFRAPIEIREVPLFDENDELYITCDQKMSVDEQLAIYAQLNAAHSAAGIHAVILNRGLRIEAIKKMPLMAQDKDTL
jgi:hypothetical protein